MEKVAAFMTINQHCNLNLMLTDSSDISRAGSRLHYVMEPAVPSVVLINVTLLEEATFSNIRQYCNIQPILEAYLLSV